MAKLLNIVLDTNVIISTLRSRRGASFAVLQHIGELWQPLISVPLILEYEAVDNFRTRPFLPDPGDEFLLELAIAGSADAIVTHNVRHFPDVEQFGIRVVTPREFLRRIKKETR